VWIKGVNVDTHSEAARTIIANIDRFLETLIAATFLNLVNEVDSDLKQKKS
jgi:hypothetical protein